ncbi:TKL/DRK protein kinase [Aphanomyces astaci]|uniref:TKL/DRK protein kinase n=2 Tax=Aphanomyces astaci TaxID=112090 RepID=W4GL50_APHAT|nr:TKL/DRK protein kinase [Aphanomyces astaci]ETV79769.1 TKL/DRK protein kinase [Aphanomyces astaci]|eukprot:XP_009830705.1 TKL/DRK protein kinase [Aphanomyces astaci]
MGIVYVYSEDHCGSSTCLLLDVWFVVGVVVALIVGSLLVMFVRRGNMLRRRHKVEMDLTNRNNESMIRKDVDQAQIQSRKNTDKSGYQFLEARNGIASFLGKTKRKTTAKELRAEDMFQKPTYEERAVMAVAPSDMRVKQEEDKLRKLTSMRRVSMTAQSNVSFKVADNVFASVYEVKLPEVHLVKQLAIGPFSEVYAGVWRGTKVGVKLLMPKETYQEGVEEAVKNFRREIWVMSRLDHPNVLQLIGASLTSSCYVLIMEYMTNGSLYEYLRDTKNILPLQLILHCAQDIVRGMLHVHEHDILQRDLKTKNLLVSDHLVVKVSDFGLSRYKDKMYGEYTFVGTPFWAAPEVIRHDNYTEKADVYSFGVVLWELIERTDPYTGMNPLQVPLLVCQEGLRPSNFKNPAPDNYVALMHECWDGDMDKRPSFAHIYQRLHGISVQYQQQTDLVAAPLATEKLSDLAAHVNHARRRASVVGKHDFECSHEAMIKKIPIKQSRSKTGSTLVTTEQIKTLRKTYLRGKR